jgi:HK97 family phage major capsid protein
MEGITEIKALVEQQGTAWEEFKSANDQRLRAIEEKGSAPAELEEKVNRINTDLTTLSRQISDIVKKSNRPGAPGTSNLSDEQVEHKQAFGRWARKGEDNGLRDIEKKAMTVGSDPDGGYFATTEIEAGVERLLGRTSALFDLATVKTIGGSKYKKRVRTSGAGYTWVGEGEPATDATTPKYATLEFSPGTLSTEPAVSTDSLEDLELSVESELMDAIEQDFGEGAGAAFVSGDGINRPRGFLSYDTVENASYAWGKLGHVVSGGASGFASSNPSDALVNLVHSLKSGYRAEASFVLNDLTLANIRKFKDGQGIYLWQPGLQAGVPGQLLGYNVRTDDNMPDLGSNTFPVAFGAWRRGYVIVRRRGIAMLRDPYTAKGWVKFYTTMRIGGGVQNFEAIKLLKCST